MTTVTHPDVVHFVKQLRHGNMIHESILENSGITVGPEPGDEPLPVGPGEGKGFAVAGAIGGDGAPIQEERAPVVNRNLSMSQIHHKMDEVSAARASGRKNTNVGGWTSEGDVVMDGAVHISSGDAALDKKMAVRAGQIRGEDAIFNMENAEDIPMTYTSTKAQEKLRTAYRALPQVPKVP